MRKNIALNTLLGITFMALVHAGCNSTSNNTIESTKKAEYYLKRDNYSIDYLASLNTSEVSGIFFRRRAESENFQRKIFEEYHPKEEIFKLWDSVAQSQFDCIQISNYLQEKAKEIQNRRNNKKDLKEIESNAELAHRVILDFHFNPLNQQVAKGDSIEIKRWDAGSKKINYAKIKFEEDLYTPMGGGSIQRPSPRVYFSEFDSRYIDARLTSNFKYNSNNDFTLRHLLAQIEMSSEAAYLLQK